MKCIGYVARRDKQESDLCTIQISLYLGQNLHHVLPKYKSEIMNELQQKIYKLL